MEHNIRLYPWLKFSQHMVFWQATWFLYFENQLSAAEAILLYAVYDLATTALEVPSGYMSDRIGRRLTMMLSAIFLVLATFLFVFGHGFWIFAVGNVALGASQAFNSGTDSSILYESLKAKGREGEVEAQELLAWRFGFSALAISAFLGGALAMYDAILPYIATALAAVVVLFLTCFLKEPPHGLPQNRRENFRQLRANLIQPTLLWILVLSLLMYLFSHIPFVFGQPFIRETLAAAGFGAQTPLVSGTVSATMMIVSVAVSLIALPLRDRLGLPGILLLAFGIQVFLVAALATSNAIWVIGLLFLRMVPNSISQPFIQARIQPLLADGTRATYLSLQSFGGRLFFAATLAWAAGQSSATGTLPYDQLQVILWAYCALGILAWVCLAATAKRAQVAPETEAIT